MDIRGIEVTNQLRSAIRAKLLELGVRYDEELPDYILVMVVNKKTRQQMHEDLHLFLEDSTTPFVEWLHDQVLKKLQKVTIAKKKATREFVPTVVVKQEEERKKRKNSAATAAAEDQSPSVTAEKVSPVVAKEEKPLPKILEKMSPIEKSPTDVDPTNLPEPSSTPRETEKIHPTKSISPTTEAVKSATSLRVSQKPSEIATEPKTVESLVTITAKRPLESAEHDLERPDKMVKGSSVNSEDLNKEEEEEEAEDEEAAEEEDDDDEEKEEENVAHEEKRLKSCVNRPKITSVVSVKNRLGIAPTRRKFEIHRARDFPNRHRQPDKRFDKAAFDSARFEKNSFDSNRFDKNTFEPQNRRANAQRGKSFEEDEIPSRNRQNDSRNRQTPRANEARNRLANSRDNPRFGKNSDATDKTAIPRAKTNDKQASTVKDRLGINKNLGAVKQSTVDESARRDVKNTIKNRLGPFRNHVRVANSYVGFVPVNKVSDKRVDDETANMETEEDQDDDKSVINVGPVKSHVIVLKRPDLTEIRSGQADGSNDLEDEDDEASKSIASKVIVTPRPLKPLQPTQKRATQSLLLRAVAEANQSVVKQKNPEPILSDKKPKLKRPKPPGTREIGKNLSVHLNATKRLVMEKIQVQLRTTDPEDNSKSKQYTSNAVNEEHMGVVMSLFQRSDDNQKFLVTLNGYNNNVIKEKNLSDEEDERLEMEVTEEDELVLSNDQTDSYEQNEPSLTPTQISQVEESEACEKVIAYENNENHNNENVETLEEAPQRKRRKLSPIVYTRTTSPSLSEYAPSRPLLSAGGKDTVEQKPITEVPLSTVTDKSREKCRYWPNCTLGSKCAYYHPAVPCGAFPACKFGDKCAYKHPKCKFGLSCTKLGCVFSHPKQQCKYHPFCTKPTCPYSHPPAHPVVPTEATRAKFTWKRRD